MIAHDPVAGRSVRPDQRKDLIDAGAVRSIDATQTWQPDVRKAWRRHTCAIACASRSPCRRRWSPALLCGWAWPLRHAIACRPISRACRRRGRVPPPCSAGWAWEHIDRQQQLVIVQSALPWPPVCASGYCRRVQCGTSVLNQISAKAMIISESRLTATNVFVARSMSCLLNGLRGLSVPPGTTVPRGPELFRAGTIGELLKCAEYRWATSRCLPAACGRG